MPNIPHLPPVAQAVAVILGVALAIFRLLTASKAFWDVLPNKLQKAIPALLVAVGLLPAALEHAKSWLDVATALTLVVGAYFTASRGDQNPPKDADGGPRIDRVNSDPKLTRDELAPPPSIRPAGGADAEMSDGRKWFHPDWRLSSFIAIGWMALACSGVPKNPQHPDPACSDESYAKLVGACAAEAAACVAKGGTEEACGATCDDDAADWQEKCQ